MVKITLHGELGEMVGKIYELNVKSTAEAIRAIEICSKHRLYKHLIEKDKVGAKYQILINESPFLSEKPLDGSEKLKMDDLKSSELNLTREDLKSIDIIPIVEGAGGGGGSSKGIIGVVLGVLLIVVGVVAILSGYGAAAAPYLITAGIGLVAAGVAVLLTSPPEFEDFGALESKKQSYLFSGPYNRIQEGGPIPIGYGRLQVGSQTISTAYNVRQVSLDYFDQGV